MRPLKGCLLLELAQRLIVNYSEMKIHLTKPSLMSPYCFGENETKISSKIPVFSVVSRMFDMRVLVLFLFCLFDLILIRQIQGEVYMEHKTITH